MTPEATASREASRDGMAVDYWLPLIVFSCAFVLMIATMWWSVGPYDEGLVLFGSTRVLSGDVPYRDFYSIYGPGQFYVLAALFKVFGPSVLVERLWDLLVRSCTVLVVYLIVDGSWSRGRALFTSALTSIWLSYFGFYGYPVFPCLLFSLLSLYCVVPIYRGWHGSVRLLASGICVGITILFRHDVGIATAVGGAVTLGLFHMAQALAAPRKVAALLRSVAIYTGAIALVVVPALALLVAAGAAHDMLVDLILIPARIYVRMRSLPFPSLVGIAYDLTHLKLGALAQLAVYLPVLGIITGVVTALMLLRGQRSATNVGDQAFTSQRLWILVQLTVFSLLFSFKGWVRVQPIHMALAIVPSLVIIGVCQVHLRSTEARVLSGIGILCLLLTSLPPMRNALAQPLHLIWRAEGSCFPPKGLERVRCFVIPEEKIEAIYYIQEHTSEDEPIFVGSNRHDKIFVNYVLFYFASKRSSVTKWHEFDPGVQTTREIQSEIVTELKASRPAYIVLSSEWDNWEEPNESARSSGVKLLDRYIRANYRVVASFGATNILRYQQQ
jgi:hypothetical protein